MAKHLEISKSSHQKWRNLWFFKICIKPEMFQPTFQAQVNYFMDKPLHTHTFSTQKHFPGKRPSFVFARIRSYTRGRREYLWHVCWNWRNCISGYGEWGGNVASNLSLLSGVKKHTEVMKNSPKQEESDLVSIPWGRLNSSREGGGKRKARKKNEWAKTEGGLVGFFFPFPICKGFCRDIKIKKREIGSKRLSRFACSRKYCWHLSLGRPRTTRFLAIVKGGFSLKSG